MAVAFLTVLHWDQAQILLGKGRPKLRLSAKRNPLPRRTLVGLLSAIAALGAAPYLEELRRCIRAEQQTG